MFEALAGREPYGLTRLYEADLEPGSAKTHRPRMAFPSCYQEPSKEGRIGHPLGSEHACHTQGLTLRMARTFPTFCRACEGVRPMKKALDGLSGIQLSPEMRCGW